VAGATGSVRPQNGETPATAAATGGSAPPTPPNRLSAAAAAAAAAVALAAAAPPAPPTDAVPGKAETPERFRPLTQQGISDVRTFAPCDLSLEGISVVCSSTLLHRSRSPVDRDTFFSPCCLGVQVDFTRQLTSTNCGSTGWGHQIQHGGPTHTQVAGQASCG
jgi:hypothetical protein